MILALITDIISLQKSRVEAIVPPSVCESCIMSFLERRLVIPVERKGDTSDQYTNDLIYTVCETKVSTSKLCVSEMLHQIQVIFRLFRTR